MSASRHAFKHAEARRLMKAAVEAGLKIKGVTLRDGRPYVEIDQGDAPAADTNKTNPLDRVLDHHAQDQKRPA